ncbi:MAG: ATP-binding cassette domain-containing protein [Pseudomonadota bacterium]|nr:ATP-binding cassette domain-containing protein [Pseudomonadota bacterium]
MPRERAALSVGDLRVVFQMATGGIEALHGVGFDIQPDSTVALVGESGSGKSVTAQAVMGILSANARITSNQQS